jgi:membrane-associated phospholipid phosphatase
VRRVQRRPARPRGISSRLARSRLARVRPGRPLLPAAARPWALALVACCALITVVIGVLVADQRLAAGVDRSIDMPLYAHLGIPHHEVLLRIVWLGSPVPVFVITALIVASCLLAGRLNGALLALLAPPAADGLVEAVLKPLFHRADLGFLSYPSGHTTAVLALGSTATVLLSFPPADQSRARVWRGLVPVAAGLAGCVVAVALIGLRWHYFTDTVGGAAVAIGSVGALALLLDLPATRRFLARIAPGRYADQPRPDPAAAEPPGDEAAARAPTPSAGQ